MENAMSRYVIWTDNDDLEVFVGFDEGMMGYFLTLADARVCTGEPGSYIFHNLEHHPTPTMRLDEVADTLRRFGLSFPIELAQLLAAEGGCALAEGHPTASSSVRVVGWQSAV